MKLYQKFWKINLEERQPSLLFFVHGTNLVINMANNKLLIIGDSLSEGKLGHSYAKYLKGRSKIRNISVQGHSVSDCVEDVDHFFKTENVRGFDAAIVMTGTIDVVVPYALNHCQEWADALGKDTFHYAQSPEAFKESYAKLLKKILEKFPANKIIVMTISPFELGMEAPYQTRHLYNKIIRDTAASLGIEHIIDPGHLTNIKPARGVFEQFSVEYLQHFKKEVWVTTHFPWMKDVYGRARHLNLTVDGLHHTSFSARRLAHAVMDELMIMERE